jgi:hypothetical protein
MPHERGSLPMLPFEFSKIPASACSNTRFDSPPTHRRFARPTSAKLLPAKRLNLPLHPAARGAWHTVQQRNSLKNPQTTSKKQRPIPFRFGKYPGTERKDAQR